MPDIQLILYKDNHAPRTLRFKLRSVYRMLLIASCCLTLLLFFSFLSMKYFLQRRLPSIGDQTFTAEPSSSELGPDNGLEQQNQFLKDQIDQLHAKLKNALDLQKSIKEFNATSPALGLFPPHILDQTKGQERVRIQNFRILPQHGSGGVILNFELHHANPDSSSEKGYIVVLGKADKELFSYPPVFNHQGAYLVDFEKGETFQVARFRYVNAQFEKPVQSFQVFIFSRAGELLINMPYEVAK